jgi:hypothetical protein
MRMESTAHRDNGPVMDASLVFHNMAHDVLDSGVPQKILQTASETLNHALLLPPEHHLAQDHDQSITCILAMMQP